MTLDLLRRHQDLVYALCYRVLRHRQDAEDAAQEALLKIARQAGEVEDPARLPAWIHRVALTTATDLARRRRTRAGYESRVTPPVPSEDPVAVHQAVAELPESERWAVVEHCFHRRTLRELADEAGVTEQAVWKRIERAKERLRGALALGALAALPLIESTSEAAVRSKDLAAAALGVKAGLSMAFVAVPLVLLAALGTVAVGRAAFAPTAPPAPAPLPIAAVQDVAPPAPPPAPVVAPPAARRPYPLALPPAGWTEARRKTWILLRDKKVTLDLQNLPLPEFLQEASLLTGVFIAADPETRLDRISFKVADITLDGVLRLALGPRRFGFQILDDGIVRVDKEDRLPPDREAEVRSIENALRAMEDARRRLKQGWDGVDLSVPLDLAVKTTRAVSRLEDETLLDRLETLKKGSGLDIILDAGLRGAALRELTEPRARAVEDTLLADHLDALCAGTELGWWVTPHNVILVTGRDAARTERIAREAAVVEQRRLAALLDRPLPGAWTSSLPDFAAQAGRVLGIPVTLSRAAWETDAQWAPESRGSVRAALDLLRARGFRWALHEGGLYVVEVP